MAQRAGHAPDRPRCPPGAADGGTLADFRLEADRSEMLPHHHGTTCRNNSHDILFRDFESRTRPLHGLNTEQASSGIV